MKTKIQILRWLMMLMLSVSALGAWAQVGVLTKTGDMTVCLNSTESYGVMPTAGSTYTWNISAGTGGAGVIRTGAAPNNLVSINWTNSGTCTLTVTELNSSNCSAVINSISITVLPLLLPGTAAADQTICYNTVPAALTSVDATGGTGNYTYQWDSSPDGATWTPITGATTSGYAPAALTATTYYRLHQTSGTCGTVITNSVKITVQPNLVVGTAGVDQTICYNTVPAPLTSVNATGGTGSYTYQWDSSPDGATWAPISGATTSGYAPATLTATTYYRLHQTSGTCGTVITNTVKITVNPLPDPTITGATPVCATTIGVIYTTETGMTGYIWSVSAGGTITAGAGTNSITVTWNTAGPQSVSVNYTNANSCKAAAPKVMVVTVNALPATSPIYHN